MTPKRPSLAETMRQVASQPDSSGQEKGPFFAATRVGKKKVTATVSPEDHKRLKRLAVDHETTTEALLGEAIADLFAKYQAS